MSDSVIERLASARIVPVVEILDANRGVELARTLADAGLPLMEVTLRTPAALNAIRAIASEVPGFLVGAGTLLDPGSVAAAITAGAHFGVSPGFTPSLSRAAGDGGLPFIPGAVTASEILSATESGHRHVKFFPAEQSGGASAIASLSAPFAALGIRFMPTGGIRPANLNAYLALSSVFAVGGTWIATRDQIDQGRFDDIGAAARLAVATVAAGRDA
ncbi:bifunctional 4-hydroxy-2-oxoglutarate aldolase/2-dehydro-3-deoxy-phosphogluconate aldolase [Glaciibacter superstes]|uniref:bifunctional 4-hydroxy-2-oxoglutarate aldolase/2-dehydro-3-deoxy-phosphogluconate aldolase n=1 Tax=Glaciibacter superstes TaxID=501023 RepID=UPI0003B36A62|nr:bifunctional 4-hydroxy-2-oxoglutarate aldolase/2-dehydro-3-deoxy-phosphogluconate aldolase [Glaciibacter superstes]